MSTNSLVVITHVPKTAGSSFRKSIIEANVPINKVYRYKKLKDFIPDILRSDYNVVVGHVPYGLHYFTTKPVKYIIFLREPIERAISHYYFLKSPNSVMYGKPHFYDYANSVSLKEFYKDRRLHNLQTRYAAGLISDKLYPSISFSRFKDTTLNKAMDNLKNHYFGIGIREYYDESVYLLQKKLGWEKTKSVHQKELRVTTSKPEVAEIDAETLQVLKQSNDLDLQLYEFALKFLVSFSN